MNNPFKVYHLFGEGYIVAQEPIIIGLPQIFDTKKVAEEYANYLNALHDLEKKGVEKNDKSRSHS